jgi:hypothetical protein
MLNCEETGATLDANLNFEYMDFASALQYTNDMAWLHITPSSSVLPNAVVGETDACNSCQPQSKQWFHCAY